MQADPATLVAARRAGPGVALRRLRGQAWGTRRFLGLRCDLEALPPLKPAGIPLAMAPREPTAFTGFADELPLARGEDAVQLLLRVRLCGAGLGGLHVADGPEGDPAYAQWLVSADEQEALHAHGAGRYPHLRRDEGLVEGAYTFLRHRRLGAMADGMGQLLRLGRAAGLSSVITYVADDNVPSLRGCARAGFALDHVRDTERRFVHASRREGPVDRAARAAWDAALA